MEEFVNLILIANLSSTFFLCGLIWIVQLVHYPFFHGVSADNYPEWMALHKKRISLIVVPVMLAELGSSFLLVLWDAPIPVLQQTGLAIVVVIWLVTFFVQVPLHNKIAGRYSRNDVDRLIATNFIRTGLWTLKAILGILILIHVL